MPKKRKVFDMGEMLAIEENPESIYFYIYNCLIANRNLFQFICNFKDFRKAKEKATPEEMKLLRVAIEEIRESMFEVEDLTATPEEVAETIDELYQFV